MPPASEKPTNETNTIFSLLLSYLGRANTCPNCQVSRPTFIL